MRERSKSQFGIPTLRTLEIRRRAKKSVF